MKGRGERQRYTHLHAEFQRIARRDKKAFPSINAKKQREKIEWERIEISSRKKQYNMKVYFKGKDMEDSFKGFTFGNFGIGCIPKYMEYIFITNLVT